MVFETLVLKVQLSGLFHPEIINHLCRDGYKKTGNKFILQFCGSKGYLSHVEILCEGYQNEDNLILYSDLFNKNGSIKKKVLNIYHSKKNGIRLSYGKDKPRLIENPKSLAPKETY